MQYIMTDAIDIAHNKTITIIEHALYRFNEVHRENRTNQT